MKNLPETKLDKIVSLCKRRGFLYQGSEIYGGLSGTFDYGPLGVALKNNVKNLWWKMFVDDREDMYGVDAAILMNPKVWQASGHIGGFSDPMIECQKCKKHFQADNLEDKNKCPLCAGKLGAERRFNMMFKTSIGASEDESSVSYLRPETAGGIFVNFKNIIDSFHPKFPFGIAQIGKAFRNEIAPRDFIFRLRELEQMEIEYFIRESDWEAEFEIWRKHMEEWMDAIGIDRSHVHEIEVPAENRAHYSKRTIDFEYEFPFGQKELYGLAYRTDFDLRSHAKGSSVPLEYYDDATGERFVPHVIEPSLGVDRTILALLCDAYTEDEMDDEMRVYLKLHPRIAPVKAAVFPLLKNKEELVAKARLVYSAIKSEIGAVIFDDNGNIGKRYRRQDEIGTPYCVTIDFDTLADDTVTVRHRDTGKQERMPIGELAGFLKKVIS